jgi:serine/threonine protein kinase
VCAAHTISRPGHQVVQSCLTTTGALDTGAGSVEHKFVELPTGAPTRVGRYEVIRHLATGGMAQIYLARIAGVGSFERYVVLKTILPDRATDHRFITMFLDEAKVAATLNHQNIAQVYEVDQSDGAYFMAMEFVHGENVRAILETTLKRQLTIPNELAMHIISGAAAGLHHAHERLGRNGQPLNIVHRDVSPANIMVGFDGSVKVLDFGIAKAEERSTKTVGNTIKGKYGYMSPEQCRGMPLDRRSDIFALGIVLYELSTLRRAFRGNDDFETMKKIVGGELMRPTKVISGYPMELEAIVMTALATRAEQRFQSGHELLEALDTYANRSKMIVGASAMSRYMAQLFGDKREPWTTPPSLQGVGNDEQTRVSTEHFPPSITPRTSVVLGNDEATSVMAESVVARVVDPDSENASTTAWRADESSPEAADSQSWDTADATTRRNDANRPPPAKPRIELGTTMPPAVIVTQTPELRKTTQGVGILPTGGGTLGRPVSTPSGADPVYPSPPAEYLQAADDRPLQHRLSMISRRTWILLVAILATLLAALASLLTR